MIKIPVDVRWKILEPSTRAAARGVYRSARRAGFGVNDSRYMVNSIIDGYFDQDVEDRATRESYAIMNGDADLVVIDGRSHVLPASPYVGAVAENNPGGWPRSERVQNTGPFRQLDLANLFAMVCEPFPEPEQQRDPQLENWDDEPGWVKSIAGLGEHRSQLENGVLVLCLATVIYVIFHIVWALGR